MATLEEMRKMLRERVEALPTKSRALSPEEQEAKITIAGVADADGVSLEGIVEQTTLRFQRAMSTTEGASDKTYIVEIIQHSGGSSDCSLRVRYGKTHSTYRAQVKLVGALRVDCQRKATEIINAKLAKGYKCMGGFRD